MAPRHDDAFSLPVWPPPPSSSLARHTARPRQKSAWLADNFRKSRDASAWESPGVYPAAWVCVRWASIEQQLRMLDALQPGLGKLPRKNISLPLCTR